MIRPFAILASVIVTGCGGGTASFDGKSMHWEVQATKAPSRAVLFVDGTERCKGRADVPLRITVPDCQLIEQKSGGMCRPPEAP